MFCISRTGAHYFFSYYSHGYGDAFMFYYYNIRCSGDETSLSQCPLQSDTNTFGHYYDIGVSCNTGQFLQRQGHTNKLDCMYINNERKQCEQLVFTIL